MDIRLVPKSLPQGECNVPEFMYTMRSVRKSLGDKVVLDNVTLSFLPGAKIGVVGPNGTGKSTLLKIMAGVEQTVERRGRCLAPGATVGMLEQEPQLYEDKNVLENVEEGVAETKSMLYRFNEISAELADPDADYDTLLAEMGELQTQLDHRDAWDLDSRLEMAMDALRCPPPDLDVTRAVRWRTSPGRAVPAAACPARPASARRAHQPPGCRERPVARAASRRLSGHRVWR